MYKKRNTSLLPIKEWNISLDVEFGKVFLWNNEFIRNINKVSFPCGVRDFVASYDLKLDILLSNLLKMQLS